MPKLVVGFTEQGCSNLKVFKGFSKPSFGVGPKADATNVGFHPWIQPVDSTPRL